MSWITTLPDFPASAGWGLTHTLTNTSGKISFSSSPQAAGDAHLIEISTTSSAVFLPGEYRYQLHVSNGDERYLVETGPLAIVADFAAISDSYDARSHVKKVLDALEASIEGRASKTQVLQTLAGVQIQHMGLDQQIKLRGVYAAKYEQEQIAAGTKRANRIIRPRFRN